MGTTDGRREFGTVGDAIEAVLAKAGGEMRVRAIHVEVERLLARQVSFYSVADEFEIGSRTTTY